MTQLYGSRNDSDVSVAYFFTLNFRFLPIDTAGRGAAAAREKHHSLIESIGQQRQHLGHQS